MVKRAEKGKEHYLSELKEMIQESKDPKEKVLAVFCQRHGISMDQCRAYYERLLAEGKIKEG